MDCDGITAAEYFKDCSALPELPQCLFRAALTTEVSTGKLRLLPHFYDEMTLEEIVDKREYLFVYNCLEMYAFSYLIIYLLL